jgi:asparagine synthase (glutamine-hydrolysing)
MAHLAVVVDPDPVRRERFATGVRRLFAELPEVVLGETTAGDMTCVWVAGPRAPIDLQRDGDRVALLLGYAVDDAGRWLTARQLAEAWLADEGERTAQDGYHVGVAYDPQRGLAAGVDPLGLFPLYHAEPAPGVTLITTTPQAFLAHPLVPWQVDRLGLAGILLAHGLLDDRPLLTAARRTPMGHRLRASIGGRLHEQRIFDFVAAPPPAGETFEEARDRIGDLLLASLRRHRPPGDDSLLMLSGGLDSRLVARCLADLGIPTKAVTFGRPRDYEVRAATAVAERLGLRLERISTEDRDGDFAPRMRRAARFSQLSSGPGGDDFACGLSAAVTTGRFHWSGVPYDWVFEPVSKHNGYDLASRTWSFDGLVAMVNAWGVPLAKLPALLGADGSTLLAAVLHQLRERCAAGNSPPERRSAVIRWDQRVRNHLAAALHQTSFAAWPLMPSTDRRFLTAVFGLPVATFADRRLEKAILLSRRPDLAAIPLDTNSFVFEPLLTPGGGPGPLTQAVRSLSSRLRRAARGILPGADPRRYERLFDVDQPRWRDVRRAAEPLRPLLERHLDGRALAGILPSPGRRLRSRSPLRAGSPIRLLCGLAFVLEQEPRDG